MITDDYKSQIRTLAIDIILGNPNILYDWFVDIIDNSKYIVISHPPSNFGKIYYITNEIGENIWLFYHNTDTDIFLCNKYLYWLCLPVERKITYSVIQLLTTLLIRHTLNIENEAPTYGTDSDDYIIQRNLDDYLDLDIET